MPATGAIAGLSGQMFISTGTASTGSPATNPVAELRDVTLSITAEALDAFSKGSSGWDEVIYGKRSWNAAGKAVYHDTTGSTGTALLYDAVTGRTEVGLTFRVASSSGVLMYTGNGLVEKWDLGNPVAGVNEVDFAVRGTRDIVRVASTS